MVGGLGKREITALPGSCQHNTGKKLAVAANLERLVCNWDDLKIKRTGLTIVELVSKPLDERVGDLVVSINAAGISTWLTLGWPC